MTHINFRVIRDIATAVRRPAFGVGILVGGVGYLTKANAVGDVGAAGIYIGLVTVAVGTVGRIIDITIDFADAAYGNFENLFKGKQFPRRGLFRVIRDIATAVRRPAFGVGILVGGVGYLTKANAVGDVGAAGIYIGLVTVAVGTVGRIIDITIDFADAVYGIYENLFKGKQFPRWGLFRVTVRPAIGRGAGPAAGTGMTDVGWQVMHLVAWFMPRAAGRRWLAEAESFLAEAPAALRLGAIRSYLVSAPLVIAMSWAGDLARRTQLTGVARPPK